MTKINNKIYIGFEPFINNDSEILILGSFPSVLSRENNFYYGNPRNRFWNILACAFTETLPVSIEEKKALCLKHKIALWDIFIKSNLKGSSDNDLSKSEFELGDIPTLLKSYPNIKKILCNGALAYNTLTKNFDIKLPIKKLTSTSPACVNFHTESWINELKTL